MAMVRGVPRCLMMSPNNSCAGIMRAPNTRTEFAHLRLRPAVQQWLVSGVHRHAELRQAEQQPLPVALVSGQHDDGFVAREFLAHAFRILERDPARELRAREAQRMHDFDEHVGETTVVVTNDPFTRGRVPLRERLGEIALHDVAAVRDHAPCEERDEARKGIPEGERDAREHANPQGTLGGGLRGAWE